ncbi:hypothetical protein HCDG_04170 [Histoplasma capsulatum H143]|uniref:Uncharacterized protein n=1 Tax=Ajellomyces capsulatus (strain H143) TaxID=544712 RepID=C6HD89_AJECH|nr:hypothetical protein HCDG_04170 [Histoplasma capsulatum H143]
MSIRSELCWREGNVLQRVSVGCKAFETKGEEVISREEEKTRKEGKNSGILRAGKGGVLGGYVRRSGGQRPGEQATERRREEKRSRSERRAEREPAGYLVMRLQNQKEKGSEVDMAKVEARITWKSEKPVECTG